MSGPEDPRLERVLENALGALSDWVEVVRVQENERRVRIAAAERARRDQATKAVMAVLAAGTIAFFFWLTHR